MVIVQGYVAPVDFPVVTTALPSAVLWDMDGTIVDTEPYWMLAETELIESYGATWTHDEALQLVGIGLWDSARIIRAKGVDLTEDQIIDWMTDRVLEQVREHVPWRPGARELLSNLSERGVRIALVTMSIRRMALHVAEAIKVATFDVIVAGDDVERPKPFPDCYLLAAEQLGVAIEDCVALEDSVPGVAAAVASGAATIAVPHIVPIGESPVHHVWQTLADRTVDDLATVLAERRAGLDAAGSLA